MRSGVSSRLVKASAVDRETLLCTVIGGAFVAHNDYATNENAGSVLQAAIR